MQEMPVSFNIIHFYLYFVLDYYSVLLMIWKTFELCLKQKKVYKPLQLYSLYRLFSFFFFFYREDGELEDGEIDDEGIGIEEENKETTEVNDGKEKEKEKEKAKEKEKEEKTHRHSRKRYKKTREKRRSKRRRRDRQKVRCFIILVNTT